MMRLCAILILMAATTIGCAERSARAQPQAVEDAELGVRVKHALVNDNQVGPRAIEVRVSRGLVILTGQVNSGEEATRAVNLVRGVPGVTDVRSQLVVREPGDGDHPAGGSSPS